MEAFPPLCPHPPLNPLAPPFLPPPPSPPTPPCSTWSKKLFNLPHIPESHKLTFFAPASIDGRLVAICSKKEVEATAESWKGAVQGFFAGKRPYLKSVIMAIERVWKLQGTMEIFPRPDDSIIFSFSSSEDRKKVLELGPWFILGRYLHLRPWSKDIRSRKEFFGSMPIWIRLPNLPLQFWSSGSISRIASAVGKPLFLDDKSANASKIQFVRICVEASAHGSLPKSISVEVEGEESGSFEQPVEYESSLLICSKCEVFGHTEESCEEAFRIKSTLKNKRSQSNNLTSSQPIVGAFTERQAIQETADRATTQKNEVLTNLSKPVWTLVTKKKKNRKKNAGKTSIMGDKEKISAQLFSNQGVRNEVALHSRVMEFSPQSENQSGPVTDNPKNPQLLAISESQVEFLEKASNAQPENQNNTQMQTVSRQPENPTSSGTLEKNLESTNRSKPDFPLERLEEHPESDSDTSDRENMEEGLEEIEKQDRLEEMVTEGQPRPPSSELVEALSVDRDVTVRSFTAAQNLLAEEIHTSEIQRANKVHSIGLIPLDNLEPSILGPPPHHDARLCLASKGQNHSLSPSKPATTLVQITSLDQASPNHNMDNIHAITQTTNLLADDSDDDDRERSFPPGFTPTKEDILTLRELMKEGVTSVPPEYQSDFLRSVDIAEDGEIVEFFQEKFKETRREDEDTTHKVRRSPRIKKMPARLTNPNFSSGLKKGFFK